MNPNSLFYAKYGTVIGLSSKVKIELSYEDNTDEVLKGGNGSGIFAFEKVKKIKNIYFKKIYNIWIY